MFRLHHLAIAFILLVSFASIGCFPSGGGGGSDSGGTDNNEAGGPPPGEWLKGDFHCHSTYSEDALRQGGDNVTALVQMSEYIGLDFLAITDHRTFDAPSDPGWQSDQVVLLPGEEWGGRAHAGTIGITSLIPEISWSSANPFSIDPQIQSTIALVQSQGGIFILNHPCDEGKLWLYNASDFDAVEVWNTFWVFPEFLSTPVSDLEGRLAELGWTQAGIEPRPQIVESLSYTWGGANYQALKFWEALLTDGILAPCVGGGDRHQAVPPGSPTTYVYASSRTIQAVLDGVRNRRTFVSRRWDGPTLDFRADADGDGSFEAMIGDLLPLGAEIDFTVTVSDALDGRLEVIKNGDVLYELDVDNPTFTFTFSDNPAQYAWYRVDVFERIDYSLPDWEAFRNLVLTQGTYEDLLTISTNLGFELIIGSGLPTVVMPEGPDKILNMDLNNPVYCRSVISSPIWVQ